MNISAINCTPIKPQASFGSEVRDVADAQRVLNLSKELNDSFQKDPDHKSPVQTAVSVAGALAATFVLGKLTAGKILEVCPNLLTKTAAGAKKAAGTIKNIKVPDKFSNLGKKVAENPALEKVSSKFTKFTGKAVESAKAFVQKNGAEKTFKTGMGVASMLALGSQVINVDGNKDGIADIAQNNVNAYSNAMKDLGVFSEILGVFS